MNRFFLPITRIFLALTTCLIPSPSRGQDPQPIPKAATSLALQRLSGVERSAAFSFDEGHRKAFVFIGNSRDKFGGWRVIAVDGNNEPRIAWDSFTLHDPYFTVTAPSDIDLEADATNGYIVTLRGCVAHQCSDGKIGFALYAGKANQLYIAHVSTQDDGSYRVTYSPTSGIPDKYRGELNKMMCSDNGISRPLTLPIKCGTH
jgi:hypothetical protein